MRVTVLGASRFGAAIAERLIETGHEVVLIDRDRARLDQLSDRLDCGMIEGDGTMPTVLRDAFGDGDEVFVAVTNASDDNILASIVARSVGYARVIPQITAAELMDICHELDLNDVINPHATVAESICAGLEGDAEVDSDATLHAELAMKQVSVPKRLAGTRLGDIDLGETGRPVAVIRDDVERFADSDMTLQARDRVLFVAARDALDTLDAHFSD